MRKPTQCLNPFDFRALLLLLVLIAMGTLMRLNPFDFRALLLRKHFKAHCQFQFVLIPLISGLCYYSKRRSNRPV